VEEVGGESRGVPFAEGDRAIPARVHGFFEGLKGLGSVLGFVAFKRALELLEILRHVGNGDGQIGGIRGVELE